MAISDGEGDRPQKRVRFDMPCADEEGGGVEFVKETLSGEPVRPQRASEEGTRQAEDPGDEGGSSDDCAWSLDSGVEDGDEEEKVQQAHASSDHVSSVARELEQRMVDMEDPSQQS